MKSTKEFLEEAKNKYPTQQDAEYLVKLMIFTTEAKAQGVSSDIADLDHNINMMNAKLWKKVFGDKSPWTHNKSGLIKHVIWDKAKAKKLGIKENQG